MSYSSHRARAALAVVTLAIAVPAAHAQVAPSPSVSSTTSVSTGGTVPTIDFELYLSRICGNLGFFVPLDDPTFLLCADTYPGGGAGAAGTPGSGVTTTNLGALGAQAQGALPGAIDPLTGRGPEGGASADWTIGRLSLFASVQTGDTDRDSTALELGYNSDSGGVLAGLDYRVTDNFSAGLSVGYTRSDADFDSNGGSLESKSYLGTGFVSWLPTDNISVGGYVGYATKSFDSARPIVFGPITGSATAGFDGDDRMAGASVGYDWYIDRSSVGVFGNVDYLKTKLDGYSETGATGLEMRFNEQSRTTLTSSVGLRGSHSFGFSWGTLTPEARGAWVHEFKDDARTITGSLVLQPTAPFSITTDDPDRDYFTLGIGAAAQFQSGPVLFGNYERWAGHSYMDDWTLNVGALIPF